jgi:hypothetical protein
MEQTTVASAFAGEFERSLKKRAKMALGLRSVVDTKGRPRSRVDSRTAKDRKLQRSCTRP